LRELLDLLDRTYRDRPVIDQTNSDPIFSFIRMGDEIQEAQDELNKYSRGESTKEAVGHELADILILLLATFRALAIDPVEHFKDKVSTMVLKFPPKLFSNGRTYDEAMKVARSEWEPQRYMM